MTGPSSTPSPDHRARSPHDFDEIYAMSTPPWDIGRPQPAFERLAREEGRLVGKVLDAGCGTGEHAILAASLGHATLGVDASATAIDLAEAKAADRGVNVRFLVFDALRLPSLGERFDTVLDCGLFHVFDDDDRARYVDSLSGATVSEGRLHLLCFSDREPGDWGPRRVTEGEIRHSFADGWTVETVIPTVIATTWADAAAWYVRAIRL